MTPSRPSLRGGIRDPGGFRWNGPSPDNSTSRLVLQAQLYKEGTPSPNHGHARLLPSCGAELGFTSHHRRRPSSGKKWRLPCLLMLMPSCNTSVQPKIWRLALTWPPLRPFWPCSPPAGCTKQDFERDEQFQSWSYGECAPSLPVFSAPRHFQIILHRWREHQNSTRGGRGARICRFRGGRLRSGRALKRF